MVSVVDPEHAVGLAAQMQNDEVSYPLVALTRDPDNSIDTTRTNFTRMHRGVTTVIDKETNNLYYEKVIPILLSYKMTVLATTTHEMDELVKELMFKYTEMYFITLRLPYECKRLVRFGLKIDGTIERSSGNLEYRNGGKIYQAIIPIKVEGAVLVSYTPVKLKHTAPEVGIRNPDGSEVDIG